MNSDIKKSIYDEMKMIHSEACVDACMNGDDALMNELTFAVLGMDLSITNKRIALYLKQKEKFQQTYLSYCSNNEFSATVKEKISEITNLEAEAFADNLDVVEYIKKENFQHRMIVKYFKEKNVDELKKYIEEVYWNKF